MMTHIPTNYALLISEKTGAVLRRYEVITEGKEVIAPLLPPTSDYQHYRIETKGGKVIRDFYKVEPTIFNSK